MTEIVIYLYLHNFLRLIQCSAVVVLRIARFRIFAVEFWLVYSLVTVKCLFCCYSVGRSIVFYKA